jgi:hypothetical protein
VDEVRNEPSVPMVRPQRPASAPAKDSRQELPGSAAAAVVDGAKKESADDKQSR